MEENVDEHAVDLIPLLLLLSPTNANGKDASRESAMAIVDTVQCHLFNE